MWKSKHAQCAGDGETKRATAAAVAGDLTVVDYRIILTPTGCRPPRPAGPPALLSLSLSLSPLVPSVSNNVVVRRPAAGPAREDAAGGRGPLLIPVGGGPPNAAARCALVPARDTD